MKIYFNRKPVTGPWGGGNKTLTAITDKLLQTGHNVVYELEEEIDLIFLDLKMPDISGLKTFRSIHKTWPAIPTIMMTGYAIDKLLEEAFELGAYGIIYKPFDVEEVLSIVNKIFEIHTPVL